MNSRSNIYILAVIFIVMAFYPAFLCAAEESMPKEPIVVNGDKVEYLHEQKEVIGTGNISIIYKDVVLTCDKIIVHLDTRDSEATGNVKVTQKGAFFTGEKIDYNFDTRQGKVVNGYLNAKPFYGRAEGVGKAANIDEFTMDRGYVTTCDLDKPHYRIQARQIKVYLNDKIVAHDILMFIGDIPVLYLPYYVQPLKAEETRSNFTVMPGQSKDWGYYSLDSYRYYLNENFKSDIFLDYRTKKGLAEGVNVYYDTKEVGRGAFKFYYTHENDNLVYDKTGSEMSRYRYQLRHRWDIPDQDTSVLVEINKLSDKNIIKDYFYNEYEELGDHPDNYVTVITAKEDYISQLLIRPRLDNFLTVTERLPEYKIDIPSYKIGNLPLYYNGLADAVYLDQKFDEPDIGIKDVDTIRLDTFNQLAYTARLFDAVSVKPYAGVRNTFYSRDAFGRTDIIRTIFNAGVDNSMKFYKIYDVVSNFMGLDIHGLRHIITPSVNFLYVQQPTIPVSKLNQFDDVDAIDKASEVHLALENRLQTKRVINGEMRSVDLATLIVSTDYVYRMEKDSLDIKEDSLKTIDFQLEVLPYSSVYGLATMSVNPKKDDIEAASIDLVMNGGEKWSLALSNRYENVSSDRSALLTMDGSYKINEKWKVRIYERFDMNKGAMQEQEYTIYRDLHCWVAEVVYDVKGLQDQSIWFMLRLKAFPEYPIGLRRTYSHPRFGSAESVKAL